MASIASLHVYPVKSCRGIDLETARVTETGLEWDRRWMIVDASGRFVTQRTHPQLATIATAIADGALRLSAAGHPRLVVDAEAGGPLHRVQIWKDSCSGIDAGDAAAAWLSRVLGDTLRLVRMDPTVPRLADPHYAGPRPQPVSFTDGYPVLLISRASLAELNRRLPAPVPMNRFRPSVVIEGVAAHAEDSFADFRAGGVVLRGVKLCTRCITTTTDQDDGSRDGSNEPLATLRTYRYDRGLRGIIFGQNCIVAAGIGASISAGDEIALDVGAPAPA
ncbi:MAG TPA: MOSC N-terminal beta barrel domain-containing protein [Steroidobacteraceae bacterium]|nr:MOSC N-terminal beta barrel domain-containing protein [Steroidobacteraceae bacterium]